MRSQWMITAIQAARLAGSRILELYRTDFSVQEKADHSPVTTADREAHSIIRSVLLPTGLPLLSEEGRDIPFEQRRTWPAFWLVDPLDGTKEFIKRNGEFTVNVALIEGGEATAGVVLAPAVDRLYFAAKGMGAFRWSAGPGRQDLSAATTWNDLTAGAQRLPLAQEPRPFTIVASRSHVTPELEKFLARMRSETKNFCQISAGSSLKFCLIAEGSADLYPRLGPTMEWDTAAGQALAEEAGARVVQYGSRAQLCYNKESLLNPWFLVERTHRKDER